MVLRLSIPEGTPMPERPESMHAVLGKILLSQASIGLEVVTVEPGSYDVTPTIWTGNTHTHELTVHDNGTGTLRMFPKTATAGIFESRNLSDWTEKVGGRTNHIDARQPIAVISGGHPQKPGILHIFEVIIYHGV